MSKVCIIGIVGESIFLSVESLPRAGVTVHAKNMFCELGGKGFNQAVAVARFGGEVSFLGAVGADGYKQKVVDFCKKEHIQPFIIEKEGKTAYAVIHTEEGGENFVSVYAGVQLSVADIVEFEKEIQKAEYLLITNEIPQDVLYKAIEIAEKYGVKVVYNPAPYQEIDECVKDKVYLFTPNEHENIGLEKRKNVIVTKGKNGSYIKSLDKTVLASADKPVDTTGAGDTFNGVLLAMLAQGLDLESAVVIANKASGKSVTKKGAITAIPCLNEIQ